MHSFGIPPGAASATAAVRAVPLVLIADDDEDILTLVALGMQLLDNQNLDDLAVACSERSRWAFLAS